MPRWTLTLAVMLVAHLSLDVATAGQAKAGTSAASPTAPAATPKSIAAGEKVFRTYCRMCHGDDAKGDGPQAPPGSHPPNLTDDTWNHGSTDAEIIEVIRKGVGPFKILDYAAMYRRAGQIFAELRSETRPRDLVRQMSGGQRQAVAIARTRIADAKIVLMDEPTAAISVRQVAEVLNLVRRLRDRGIAVVFISHRMPDVFSVADRVVVLRRGRKVADKDVAASSLEEVTGLITGAIEHA